MTIPQTPFNGLTIAGQPVDDSEAALHEVVKHLTVPAARQSEAAFGGSDAQALRALELPLARQIVEAWQLSPRGHAFASLADALDEIRFRLAAIAAMSRFNTGAYDVDYFNPDIHLVPRLGSAGPALLSRFWQFFGPDGASEAQFAQAPDTPAAQAMAPVTGALLPFRGECAGGFQMAVYLGLLNGLGAARFDEMAAKWQRMYIGPWRIGEAETPNPATLFMISAPLDAPPVPGDYLYFKNKDDYLHWAPEGFWTGLNAMYMGMDALGTRHYSGMGASWLSETNLRASLVNAYYHDCAPHVIDDPATEVRFTQRRLLQIPADIEAAMAEPTTPKGGTATPTSSALLAAGFAPQTGGVFAHPGTTLAELCAELGFAPGDLQQVRSAGIDNTPHRVMLGGAMLIVTPVDPGGSARDPGAWVRAHLRLDRE
ncbi:hypothetical protein AYJ57_22495 (plasmid) [Salipiger sp. CCB-MM3]|uniref:hypothetical protein n=1 Tax=Salipiger sp. CCB-MM3 TaxID=1792508 RepID=UPI00080AC15C|nr:hypothetical protein [Salipiger sp. CCB-MM3]ANT63248.1 hypothetical protein AYJ57_22495 [Salipiger sp. CCB-MM3]